ncbi:TolC family protein [Gemmatimonas sp.]|uniref:TolC family protein n=1 Tax=Gemmatimonas sp. TaxID=1962908 RepID=UPI00286D9D19|nr:TolC family protein [Gemmatimonas sp.]
MAVCARPLRRTPWCRDVVPLCSVRAGALAPVSAAVLIALLTVAATSASAQSLSYTEALQRVQDANERIRSAGAGVDRARADRDAARGRRLPEVSVAGRSTRIDDDIVIDLDPIRQVILGLHPTVPSAAIPSFTQVVQRERFNNLTLNASVPLFSGGRISAGIRAANAGIDVAREQERGTRHEVATELAQRYFGLQLANENRLTREVTRDNMAQHVERARSLERNGQIARAERLRAEVALADTERDLQQAVREQRMASLALASTISSDTAIVPTTPLFRVGDIAPVDSFQAIAEKTSPILARLAAEQARAREATRAARGELLPTVGAFLQRELYTKDLTLLQPTWATGVALSVPVFQGGQRLNRIEAAHAVVRQVDFMRTRARRDIALLTASRYELVQQARDQLVSLEATQALAEESLRAQRVAFAAGLATSLDVVDAEQALARVRLGMLKARYDADIALAGLLEAAGISERFPEYITKEAGR